MVASTAGQAPRGRSTAPTVLVQHWAGASQVQTGLQPGSQPRTGPMSAQLSWMQPGSLKMSQAIHQLLPPSWQHSMALTCWPGMRHGCSAAVGGWALVFQVPVPYSMQGLHLWTSSYSSVPAAPVKQA